MMSTVDPGRPRLIDVTHPDDDIEQVQAIATGWLKGQAVTVHAIVPRPLGERLTVRATQGDHVLRLELVDGEQVVAFTAVR